MNDYYAVLGVAATASSREITHAFHRLVRSYHPDLRTDHGDPEGLREVIAAYEVLRDPVRRADYDRRLTPRPPNAAPSQRDPDIHVGPVRYHGRRW